MIGSLGSNLFLAFCSTSFYSTISSKKTALLLNTDVTIDQVEEQLIEEIRNYEHFNSSVICTVMKQEVTERRARIMDSPAVSAKVLRRFGAVA